VRPADPEEPVKLRLLGALALLAASLMLVAACSSEDPDPETATNVLASFEGVEASGATVGDPAAPVEVIEFLDLQCPFCKIASEEIIPVLLEDQVKTGNVKMTANPIGFLGPASVLGARGAAAAQEQDLAWPFIETILANQEAEGSGWLTEDLMRTVAGDLGLDVEKWDEDLREGSEATFNEWERTAQEAGIQATPTFVVRGPGGEQEVASADPEAVNEAIALVSES
jgi:protein-disulfide isomerase